MNYLAILLSFFLGSTDQRCYRGSDANKEQYYLFLKNDYVFEMSHVVKFSSESRTLKIEGQYEETDSTIVINKYFEGDGAVFKKVGKSKLKIHFFQEEIQLKQFICSPKGHKPGRK